MNLTEEQFQAAQSLPAKVEHKRTGTVYYLISEQQYQRLRAVVADDNVRSLEPLLADLQPEDWEDAASYQS